jgi:hypothetical protein
MIVNETLIKTHWAKALGHDSLLERYSYSFGKEAHFAQQLQQIPATTN